jgi:hypothetical protein
MVPGQMSPSIPLIPDSNITFGPPPGEPKNWCGSLTVRLTCLTTDDGTVGPAGFMSEWHPSPQELEPAQRGAAGPDPHRRSRPAAAGGLGEGSGRSLMGGFYVHGRQRDFLLTDDLAIVLWRQLGPERLQRDGRSRRSYYNRPEPDKQGNRRERRAQGCSEAEEEEVIYNEPGQPGLRSLSAASTSSSWNCSATIYRWSRRPTATGSDRTGPRSPRRPSAWVCQKHTTPGRSSRLCCTCSTPLSARGQRIALLSSRVPAARKKGPGTSKEEGGGQRPRRGWEPLWLTPGSSVSRGSASFLCNFLGQFRPMFVHIGHHDADVARCAVRFPQARYPAFRGVAEQLIHRLSGQAMTAPELGHPTR